MNSVEKYYKDMGAKDPVGGGYNNYPNKIGQSSVVYDSDVVADEPTIEGQLRSLENMFKLYKPLGKIECLKDIVRLRMEKIRRDHCV